MARLASLRFTEFEESCVGVQADTQQSVLTDRIVAKLQLFPLQQQHDKPCVCQCIQRSAYKSSETTPLRTPTAFSARSSLQPLSKGWDLHKATVPIMTYEIHKLTYSHTSTNTIPGGEICIAGRENRARARQAAGKTDARCPPGHIGARFRSRVLLANTLSLN